MPHDLFECKLKFNMEAGLLTREPARRFLQQVRDDIRGEDARAVVDIDERRGWLGSHFTFKAVFTADEAYADDLKARIEATARRYA